MSLECTEGCTIKSNLELIERKLKKLSVLNNGRQKKKIYKKGL